MLDFFTIFSKGGIVLWCFQGTAHSFTASVNALIKSVILQERGGSNSYTHEALTLKYKLDNEFELVFVVAYQKTLQLSYVDKFLSDIQMEFRNKYKDDLQKQNLYQNFDFGEMFHRRLKLTEEAFNEEAKAPRKMKTFEESQKSKKTVASMIKTKAEDEPAKGSRKKAKPVPAVVKPLTATVTTNNVSLDDETILRNREKMFMSRNKSKGNKTEKAKDTDVVKKKGKENRTWQIGVTAGGGAKDAASLDFSSSQDVSDDSLQNGSVSVSERKLVGQMKGNLRDIEVESEEEEEEEEEEDAGEEKQNRQPEKKSSRLGFLSGLRNLVGSKTLTKDDIAPILEKMRDHLICKNVAIQIAEKLCDSVATELEGRVLGSFTGVSATVRQALQSACVQLLSPHRRVDILRDVLEAKQMKRSYTITFCGVNGVGKSTNLAKVAFWLVENGLRVLIAACDTFRAGAVEQLRTHVRRLNALHPAPSGEPKVQLYEQGYGKDAAAIAMQAINFARDMRIDVTLVDTAGRMQDNEPLMRALSKLIRINQPDLVLFVGEALVGNEAVDQLVKFNQALADHSQMDRPHLIDGILLTKFDTIDDKVGAAISMTYTTGQPIVFVGTGQTYTDLRNLNAKAVVSALLKA